MDLKHKYCCFLSKIPVATKHGDVGVTEEYHINDVISIKDQNCKGILSVFTLDWKVLYLNSGLFTLAIMLFSSIKLSLVQVKILLVEL